MTTVYGADVSRHQPHLTQVEMLHLSFAYGKLYDPAFDTWTRDVYVPAVANVPLKGIYVTGGPNEDGPDDGAGLWMWAKDQFPKVGVPLDGSWMFILDALEFGLSIAAAKEFIGSVQADGFRVGQYHSESGYDPLGADYNVVAHFGIYPARPVYAHTIFQYNNHHLQTGGDSDLADMTVDQLRATTTTKGVVDVAGEKADAFVRQLEVAYGVPADAKDPENQLAKLVHADLRAAASGLPSGDVPATLHFGETP